MAKAKKIKETTEKLTFTITDINKENGTFLYFDEFGEEKEGQLDSVFMDIKLPLDVTLKTSNKEELDVQFEKSDEDDEDDED